VPPRSRNRAQIVLGALALVAVLALVVALLSRSNGSPAARRGLLESIFQDDDHLIYAPTVTVERTLDQLRALGVDRLRLTVLWSALAPQPTSPVAPAHFDARNPAAYAPTAWYPYDRVIVLARQRGMDVDLNLTAPGPLWAMTPGAASAKDATHLRPDPAAFGAFVAAVGRRYDGSYTVSGKGIRVTLPRVGFWSIWNEPNQPGWLLPQWRSVGGQWVMDSPRLYRLEAASAFSALEATGHTPARDTILIGELAPEGPPRGTTPAPASAIPPLSFLRTLYCLDGDYHPLQGPAAALQHCPSPGDFVRANPALFQASGFAHHPYFFFRPPGTPTTDPDWASLADLPRLEHAVDRALGAYGVHRRLPIYLTEYGYETNPPNPFRGVSLGRQSLYLDEAEFLAARDPRVRALAQFLLVDAAPNPAFPPGTPGYWSTFQTGLEYLDGRPKPSFGAYRLPIFVPSPSFSPGASVQIWGMLRAARNGTRQEADIQWRGPGQAFRTVARISTSDPDGFFTDRLALPGSGRLRIAWRAPDGQTLYSRAVAVQRR
jgi:hypothetical protein